MIVDPLVIEAGQRAASLVSKVLGVDVQPCYRRHGYCKLEFKASEVHQAQSLKQAAKRARVDAKQVAGPVKATQTALGE